MQQDNIFNLIVGNALAANFWAIAQFTEVSKAYAEAIVGAVRLRQLECEGKIMCRKTSSARNGKCRYLLSDVLQHAKNFREKKPTKTIQL